GQLLEDSPIGYEVVAASRWRMDPNSDELRVDRTYANFAQTLGGCPDNEVSGRFKAVSILSTATQEAFIGQLCNPSNRGGGGVRSSVLLPDGVSAGDTLSAELAQDILAHQVGSFFSRRPVDEELQMAEETSAACLPAPCDAEAFARAS